MRQSREVKAETHEAIVSEASRLFRERGIEGTSVNDVMQAAQKTHGGFYRHFENKGALLTAALDAAFNDMVRQSKAGLATTPVPEALSAFVNNYLSDGRVADVGGGCPVAALSGDVAREAGELRHSFARGVMRLIDTIAAALDGPPDDRQRRAAQAFALAAGALMIARASDPETAKFMLASARQAVDKL